MILLFDIICTLWKTVNFARTIVVDYFVSSFVHYICLQILCVSECVELYGICVDFSIVDWLRFHSIWSVHFCAFYSACVISSVYSK